MLDSVFKSINMGLDHKLILELFLILTILSVYFAVELQKDKYRDFL